MIRKQVYIEPHQEALLKKSAGKLGVTEAELIRRAIDAHLKTGFQFQKNTSAWEDEKQFILSRIKSGKRERKRNWQREELYDR